MDEMIQSIYEELMADIHPTREGEESVLLLKTKNAYREVQEARNYPDDATDEYIEADMKRFRQVVYNLAMYDFNIRGAEWQTTINENGEYRSFYERSKLMAEITPFAIVV